MKTIEEIVDKYIDPTGVGKIENTAWLEDRENMIKELKLFLSEAKRGNKQFVKLLSDASYILGLAESQFPNHPRIKKFKENWLDNTKLIQYNI